MKAVHRTMNKTEPAARPGGRASVRAGPRPASAPRSLRCLPPLGAFTLHSSAWFPDALIRAGKKHNPLRHSHLPPPHYPDPRKKINPYPATTYAQSALPATVFLAPTARPVEESNPLSHNTLRPAKRILTRPKHTPNNETNPQGKPTIFPSHVLGRETRKELANGSVSTDAWPPAGAWTACGLDGGRVRLPKTIGACARLRPAVMGRVASGLACGGIGSTAMVGCGGGPEVVLRFAPKVGPILGVEIFRFVGEDERRLSELRGRGCHE